MHWSQTYAPLGGIGVSALVAAIPVIILLGLLAFWHVRAHLAALVALTLAAGVAVGVYGMPLKLTLAAAGYAVYLLEHRGDRSALPPEGALPFSLDDIATRDIGAALDAIRAHSGFERVLCVGHGLGAQALYLRMALEGTSAMAALVSLCGAVCFSAGVSAARNAGLVAALLPSGWVLPGRRLQQLAAPFVLHGDQIASPDTPGPVARARLRYAAGDLHGGVIRQMARWVAAGHLTDASGRLDIAEALRPFPALLFAGDDDPACPPAAALPAANALGAPLVALTGGWGHLDPLLGARAPAEVVRQGPTLARAGTTHPNNASPPLAEASVTTCSIGSRVLAAAAPRSAPLT
jgi:predicted alpha/beta hydrolase